MIQHVVCDSYSGVSIFGVYMCKDVTFQMMNTNSGVCRHFHTQE